MENKLINVSKQRFYQFINLYKLKPIPGIYTHSEYYINEKGEKLAYVESSSWHNNIVYKILGNENEETLNLVNNIFNKYEK